MSKRCITDECLSSTGFSYTLSLINGKYKMTILYTLMEFGVVRFNEMKKYIGEISYKTLSSTLKELEADQLVHREEYRRFRPKWNTASRSVENPLFLFWTECASGATRIASKLSLFFQSKSLSLLSASHLASSASLFSYSLRISLAESLPRANLWGHCPLFISFTSTSPALSGFPGWS